jgi:hypothetical protein
MSLTTSLVGPLPWTSHDILNGPPRPAATGEKPDRVALNSQCADLKAGCAASSLTVGRILKYDISTNIKLWNENLHVGRRCDIHAVWGVLCKKNSILTLVGRLHKSVGLRAKL